MQLPARNTVIFYLYGMLLSLGVALYVAWGILYNAWNLFAGENLGIYALVVIMVVFGAAGMLLYGGD